MRFTVEDLCLIAGCCRDMAQFLESIVEKQQHSEADLAELRERGEQLRHYGQGLEPAEGCSLVELESEDKFEHPRRTREAFRTMLRDMQASRMLPMHKMLSQGAVILATSLAAGDVDALEDMLTRLGFLRFEN